MPVSRRALLASTTAALAAAAEVAPVRLPGKVRLGILDVLGHLGDVTSHLKDAPDVEVVAVAVENAADFSRLARNPRVQGAKHYTDVRRMLDS